jgi:shikimate kinase
MFLDTDELIEKETGFTIPQLFEKGGEPAFRKLESRTVQLVALMDRAVIATGGGVPLLKENMDALERTGVIVCLDARPETILERLKDGPESRPLLAGKDGRDPYLKVHELLSGRRAAYGRAKHTVPTDGLTTEQVAEKVLSAAGLS